MVYHRGFCHDVETLHFKVVALSVIFWLATCGPCTITGTQNPTGYDQHGSHNTYSSSGPEDVSSVQVQTSVPNQSLENICKHSDMFCFPSTLSGFLSDFQTTKTNVSGHYQVKGVNKGLDDDIRSSNHANFQLFDGTIVSCSLESEQSARVSDDKNDTSFLRIKSNHVNDFSSKHVQISNPLLNWGQQYLHLPSLAYLTVENKHESNILNVFEPYSSNRQFYPCNYSEIVIRPGEIASLCFVFFPKRLGLSSGHLILQTNSGGFVVRAQGFAVQPPYMLQSSLGLSQWVISLSNPSKDVLHLKEVSASMSFSSKHSSYLVNGVCRMVNHTGSSEISVDERLDFKIGQFGQPVMAIRPQKTWTIGSNHNEPILEIDFPYRPQSNLYGSVCVQLLNNTSRDNNMDTIIFETEFGGKSGSYNFQNRLSTSLDVLTPCDANGTIGVALLVENDGPDLLTVVNISTFGENRDSLLTKYVKGLILFPYSVTQVAIVTYAPNLHMNLNCKLVLHTNKSNDFELQIPCSEFANFCSRSRNVNLHPPLELKATEMTKSDESVLQNWRSQGTEDGMSVLDDHEVIFPMVLFGTHGSKWIKVKNPSNKPVIMQLLLNSGEIINECRESDENFQSSSSYTLVHNSHNNPLRYGFSIPHNAVTEAYVHPHGETILGPVVFHPSGRCAWKSSLLVRNNLSGVEWLPLRGSGGSVSLILHDGSGPVHSVELKHNYGQPFMKVLFAKNTGDLPVKVNKITVSGTKCELDGFVVGNCNGFALHPGESRKIILSYHAETCAETVLRDLELGMVGGILVVPVKVTLPKVTLAICTRSLFWIKFKKFVFAALFSILLVFIACSGTFSVMTRDENLPETKSSDVCLKPDTSNTSSLPSASISTTTLMAVESPKPENLTVKTGKDKARRRKKKRSSGTGLTGYFDGLSSHSSNSTPSSPLSPVKCCTPKRSPELSPNQTVRARSPFSHRARSPFSHNGSITVLPIKDKASTQPKTTGPFARAPGSGRKAVKPEESLRVDAGFEYNLWDYHFQLSDLGLFEVGPVMHNVSRDDNFGSFFETYPQVLFTIPRADTVSFKQND